MTWRVIWLRAQLTGIAVSCMVWLVLSALEPNLVALGWLAGAVVVAAWPTRLALRLRCGGRPIMANDRERVLRAVAPIRSLRGRRAPEVWVSRRRSVGLIVGQHELVVSEKMLDGLRTRRLSDLHFATLTARAVGVAAVNRSRLVAAVELFCLPWSLVRRLGRHLQPKAPRRFVATHIQRCVAGLVLTVAAIDLYQRALWVSLVMVVLVGVVAVTTGRFNRAWAVRLGQMAEAEVRRSGLAPEEPAKPDPWAFLSDECARHRRREVWP